MKYDDAEALAAGLAEQCTGSRYRSILHAVPMAVGEILRDYPKDRDRNNMVLDIIQAAVYRRFHWKSVRQMMVELKAKAKPALDYIAAVRDHRLRCATVLELIDLIGQLVEVNAEEDG